MARLLAAATFIACLALAHAAHAATPSLTAEFVQTSVWSTGYGADYVLTNGGETASTSWVVEFDLPSGSAVSGSWSSVRTRSGQHYRFTNVTWNGDIAPGASESFGFNVTGLGTPTNCAVNGIPCTGGDTTAPSIPTGLRATGATSSSVSLAWDPSTDNVGVVGYEVGGTSVTGTAVTVTGLVADTAYTFTATARDAAGNVSAASQPLAARTLPAGGGGSIVDVSTAAQLATALSAARPGQTIRLASGTYRGAFLGRVAGTVSAPITLTGPRTAVLTNDGPTGTGPSCPVPTAGWSPGYGLWLFNAPHWNMTGFTVANVKKGIVLDNSDHVTIDGVYVHHTQDEAIHFRRSSADGVLRNSQVDSTGLVQPGFGEAVYIGSANSNWACHGNSGGVDRSDRVQVLGNRFGPNVAAEHIDVKEGTVDGVIRGNTFDGRGISGQNSADSWVDAKGTGYLVEDNTGTFSSPGTFANGYETHNPVAGSGCGNVWRNNRSDLGGVGRWAINVTSTSKCAGNLNVVYASNTVTNAVNGLTNITVTP